MTQVQGRGLVPLVSIVYGFGDFYENLKHFEDRFFLVTLIHQEAYAVVYDVRDGVEVSVFPKYWNDSHFLIGNGLYIYKEDDFSQKELYLKKKLMSFAKDLGYTKGLLLRMKLPIKAWNA